MITVNRIVLFCIILLFISACAKNHEVNITEIERIKDKTFKIGIVKVAGRRWGLFDRDNVEKKKDALGKIPVTDICDILSKNYGMTIDTQSDLVVKVVKEDEEQSYSSPESTRSSPGMSYSNQLKLMKSENPYFGNKEYTENGVLKGLLVNPILKGEDIGDTVDIIYSYSCDGFPLKDKYHYEIIVKSDDIILIRHYGDVAVSHWNSKAYEAYNQLVFYADKLPEALERDISAK